MDDEQRYRAVHSRDARFDGRFFTAVTSTGIYCRPSCPAITPKREHLRFHPSAASAQAAGFRACKRCRPDAAPGSPEWDLRGDVVGRAVRLIADGTVDRDGVHGLAAVLGYSERQLHRHLTAELGAGALALARAQRAQTARLLIETTPLEMTRIAFASGFASIRQFNDTLREVFAESPSQLRARAQRRNRAEKSGPGAVEPRGVIELRLAHRPPYDFPRILAYLGRRAVAGVEEVSGDVYRRVLRLPHGTGTVEIGPHPSAQAVRCRLRLGDLRDLAAAVHRCRRLLDLDADPQAVTDVLGTSELAEPLARTPGLRCPGQVDPGEAATRAVLGQQVSVAAARTHAARLTARFGKPLDAPDGGLTHAFPTPEVLAEATPEDLPVPRARARALISVNRALAAGELDLSPGADRSDSQAKLLALPGIGPWTAGYIRMRALGDPDVFLAEDLGIRQALARMGLDTHLASARRRAERWAPFRSYASQLLWNLISDED